MDSNAIDLAREWLADECKRTAEAAGDPDCRRHGEHAGHERDAGPEFVEQIVEESIADVGDDAKGVADTITPPPNGCNAVGIQLKGASDDVLARVQGEIEKRTSPPKGD